MNKLLFVLPLFFLINIKLVAQQQTPEPLVYSRVLIIDSVNKNEIYDKALLWCTTTLTESKAAINISDKESGVIAGKSFIDVAYKVPGKKDSIISTVFSDYSFDWLIEVKDNKARFSVMNVIYRDHIGDHIVYINSRPPGKVMLQKADKTQIEWDMSQKYFIRYVDEIVNMLQVSVNKKNDNW